MEYIRSHLERLGCRLAITPGDEETNFVKWIEDSSLEKIESEFAQGLTSRQILTILDDAGLSLSEATLRKYVQLGLLPRSVRVGQKGKHQGSKGVYPVRVIRQILLIRRMMAQGYTIEQIQREFLFLRGDLEQLEDTLGGVIAKLGEVAAEEGHQVTSGFVREVRAAEAVGRDLMIRLRTLESRLMAERRQARLGSLAEEVHEAVG